jgi:DNA-binding NarL/FixJ family response regulator
MSAKGMSERCRVVVADDDESIRRELIRLLSKDYDVVAAVENGRELVNAVRDCKPDVAIVDVSMPVMNGFEALRQMNSDGSETKVIFCTVNGNSAYTREAFSIGAAGYVLKGLAAEELPCAIEVVLTGGRFVSSKSSARSSVN